MSTTLTVNPLKASVGWDLEQTNSFGANSVNTSSMSFSTSMTDGSGVGQSHLMYAATLTIAASGTSSLDFITGLNDPLGNALAFAKIKWIYINLTTTTTSASINLQGNFLTQTSGTTSPITAAAGTPELRIVNGGVLVLGRTDSAGYAVVTSTQHVLTITNEDASNAATVNVFICGA